MKFVGSAQKIIIKTLIFIVLALNGIAYVSAYLMTHYKTENKLSLGMKRSQNYNTPQDFNLNYTSHKIKINQDEWLDSWFIKSPQPSQGVVILFHGKDNNKSSLVDAAKLFNKLNYDTLLIDFRGSGKSSGFTTTIGVEEAKDVVAAVNYLDKLDTKKPVILYGISMGSAAILRAIAEHDIQPDKIILELPFTTLLAAVKTRLHNAQLPPSPMAELLVFWGGIQHGFNGFTHKPIEYAKVVNCPTLILAGQRDRSVNIREIKNLYQNFDVPKNLVIFPQAGHEILARKNQQLWQKTVEEFLQLQENNQAVLQLNNEKLLFKNQPSLVTN